MKATSSGTRALLLLSAFSLAGACSTFSSGKKKTDGGDGDGDGKSGTGSTSGDGDGDGDTPGDGDGDGDMGGANPTGDGDGDTGLGVPNCDGVEDIPTISGLIAEGETITIGPGCVRMEDTNLEGSLTVAPGTRVLLEAGANIEIRSVSTFTAEGTEDAPIVFQSEHPDPRPGDWDCFLIWSERVNIEHASFLHGGRDCVLGAEVAAVTIQADVDKFANVTIESSDAIGLNLSNSSSESGNISGLTFADIDGHSLFISPNALSLLSGPIVLDEDETALAVNADDPVNEPTTMKNLGLPYRLWNGELWVEQPLTIEPGVTLLLTSGVGLYTPAGYIEAIGTAEEPIVWTSPLEAPTGSDLWGTIDDVTGLGARFEYNHFEYGGDGVSESLLLFRNGEFELSNVSFANIETSAIKVNTCTLVAEFVDAWCALEFTNVNIPVSCYEGVEGYINACE